jgi:membrane-bound lytic murein transglycosylase D
MLGSWELALASYNWGEGAVARAVQRNEARGARSDYLALEMPAETRNYVPKLMAVRNIVANPERFGLTLAEVPNRPYFTVVTTARHIDVKLAAKLAQMPLDEFQALNPSHNRPVIRADAAQAILLPADRAEAFEANLQAHGDALTSWQSYTIGRGERIERVAQRFGIAPARLKEINGIPARLRNLAGLTILVPAGGGSGGDVAAAGFAPSVVAETTPAAAVAARTVRHVVKTGETLSGIARRYRVSTSQLAAQNGIRNGKIRVGQALVIGPTAPGRGPRGANAKRSVRSQPATPAIRSTSRVTRRIEAAKADSREGRNPTRLVYAKQAQPD